MRSLCDELWRRCRHQDTLLTLESAGPVYDPERVCAAAEALAAIHRLFASDALARKVITGSSKRAPGQNLIYHPESIGLLSLSRGRKPRNPQKSDRAGL
jgi:hypothetical protein